MWNDQSVVKWWRPQLLVEGKKDIYLNKTDSLPTLCFYIAENFGYGKCELAVLPC